MLKLSLNINDMAAKSELKGLRGRLSKPQQALKECGLVLLRSISKNFKQGGKPEKWDQSARAKRDGGKTLINTARLKNSITMQFAGKDKLVVGTNVKYAAIHNLGGRVKKNVTVKKFWRYMDQAFGKSIPARHVLVKAHERKMNLYMPKREFMLVQEADYRVFKRIFEDYLVPK